MAKIILDRPPKDDTELYYLVQALWGVTIPRHKVCPDHDAPFDAFSDAYFERNGSIALWHGSRGLSGKSFMVSILGITKAFIKGADVNLLGGSLAQSTNIHEHMRNAFGNKNAPVYMIESEGNYLIKLNNRARIRPLTASQKTVRGPHPPFLICDEIDEMDEDILNAALGQPMPQKNYAGELIKPYTVMVSTWQNSDGCVLLNTPITTDSGIKNVQDVVVGDKVPTRDGWRSVTASINTGRQECVSVDFASGRRLTCTPWHRIWTDAHGWVEASLLQPGFVVSSNVLGVGGTVLSSLDALADEASAPVAALDVHIDMPVVAHGLGHLEGKAAGVIDGLRDDFQMAGVDAGTVATQVVDSHVVGNGSVDLHPYPAVGKVDALSNDESSVGLVSVPVLSDSVGPEDAVVGRKIDGYTFAEDEVVRVTHTGMVLPTWDLTVDGSPEYVAEGILVHNTFEHKYREFQEKGLPIRTWCVAQDSLVTTSRGEILIQEVTDSDFVLTRNGFRKVQHVTFMGYKPTIGLNVGDKTLWATDDHLVAVDNGWRHVGALAADSMSPVRPNPSVLGCELVPLAAMSSTGLIPPSSGFVLGVGNQVKVLDVDAPSVATQVIDRETRGDGTENVLPDPAMGLDDSILSLRSLGSVAVALTSRPVNAVSGEHGNIILPVWDIGVEGDDHEFVANGVLVHNCYKDTANPIDGWLSQETIEQKKREIPKEMWRVEYELGEPSIGNRAFDTDKVEETFSLPFEPIESEVKDRYERYVFEKPVGDGVYVVAADWAKEQDYTVITVMRVDRQPHTLVYYQRMNRRPYPVMISDFNKVIDDYNAEAIHDATGLGNVVNDYIDVRARKFIMSGEKRSNMLTEYVGAVERNYFTLPQIPSLYSEMKYCRTGDLYSNTKDYHLPDTVCSMALAWHMAKRHSGYGPAITITKGREKNLRYEKHFEMPDNATESIVSPMTEGVVVNKTADLVDGINLLV